MAWREFLFSAVRTAYRALPPCHICGEPGAQFCRQCGKVACHKHAFTNVAALKSVCNHCMPFPWVATEASGVSISPDWQYSEMPWEVLGISESASVEEIKEAHRTLSKHYHPDVVGGSTELQVKVNKARDEMLRVRGEA